MSSEWRMTTVEEIAAPRPAAMATGPFGSSISAKYFVPSGVPVIRGGNLSADVTIRLNDEGLVFVSEEKASEFQRSTAVRGDLVFTCWGTINQVGLVDASSRYTRYVVSNKQMKLSVDPTKADSLFLYYLFSGPEKQEGILNNGIGSSVPGFNLGQLKKHVLLLPPLREQEQIAAMLGSLDGRIALLRETNATLEAIAQALFKSWFVDFDPVRTKSQGLPLAGMDEATATLFPDSFEESALGFVPKGWRPGVLGEVVRTIKSQLHPSELHAAMNYVGLEHLPRKSLSVVNWETADGLESAKAKFSEGDVLFGKLRPYFHKVVVAPFDGVCSTDILVCQSKQRAYYGFAAMQLFSAELIAYADRLSNGAKMPRIGWNDIAAYPLIVPSEAIASAYTAVVSPVLDRMKGNVFRAQTLATLRDTLLPRLISGQLRLPEAQALVAQ